MTRQVKNSLLDTTHTVSKTYNVYTQAINEYEAWKFYGNFYLFFKPNTKGAIHVATDVEFRNGSQNPVNAMLGYIFSFKNNKDNSTINVELYFKLIDITRALPQDESKFFNRNSVGLTFGVPLNIPTVK